MGISANNIEKLAEIKEAIRNAIVANGFLLSDNASFAEYAAALGGTAPVKNESMITTQDRLSYINAIKEAIRQAIIMHGVDVPASTPFSAYPDKIAEIRFEVYAILYYDGTFVFQSDDVEDSSHGKVVAKYNDFLDNEYVSASEVPWNIHASKVKSVIMTCKVRPKSTAYMFHNMTEMTSCDIEKLDTSATVSMRHMFYNCKSLTSVDVSRFNTGRCTDMQYMFGSCESLEELDLSSFDTSNVEKMRYMFYNCMKIRSIDVSSFDVSKVTHFSQMFNNCYMLTDLDTSRFVTTSATDMQFMFANCHALEYIELYNFYTSNVVNMRRMFYNVYKVKWLDISSFDMSKCTDALAMFGSMSSLETVAIGADWRWVSNCYLPTPSGGKWHAEMRGGEYDSNSIPERVADIYHAEKYYDKATATLFEDGTFVISRGNPEYKAWEPLAGEIASPLFVCTGFENMSYPTESTVPWYEHRNSIRRVIVEDSERPIRPISTANWFNKCHYLSSAYLSKLDGVRVSSTNKMFANDTILAYVDMPGFKTVNNKNTSWMFANCKDLDTIDISGIDMNTVVAANDMFYGADNLKDIKVGDRWRWLDGGLLPKSIWYNADRKAYAHDGIPDGGGRYFKDTNSIKLTGNVKATPEKADVGEYVAARVEDAQNNAVLRYQWYKVLKDTQITIDEEYYPEFIPPDEFEYRISFTIPPHGGIVAFGVEYDYTLRKAKSSIIKEGNIVYEDAHSGLKIHNVYLNEGFYILNVVDAADADSSGRAEEIGYGGILGVVLHPLKAYEEIQNSGTSSLKITEELMGSQIVAKVMDASGKYIGELESNEVSVVGKKAFAVFSADDRSLNFYKRSVVPSVGEQFEGKTVTDVYRDVENTSFQFTKEVLWNSHIKEITSIKFVDEIEPVNTRLWFYGMSSCWSMNLKNLNTSNTIDMSYMFHGCSTLDTVDLSGFDTSNVKNFNLMFAFCSDLNKLTGIEKWNVSNVEDMTNMFEDCTSLKAIDLSRWSTPSLTKMSYMFIDCYNLEEIYMDNWITTNVADSFMLKSFYGCRKLQLIRLSDNFAWQSSEEFFTLPAPSDSYISGANGKWYDADTGIGYEPGDIPNNKAATYLAVMPRQFAVYSATDNSLRFYNTRKLPWEGKSYNGRVATRVYFDIDTLVPTSTSKIPWYPYRNDIENVVVEDEINPVSLKFWFYEFKNCLTMDLSKMNTSSVSDMSYAFRYCSSLGRLDLEGWDTSNVTDFKVMFENCYKLRTVVGIVDWNVSSARDISNMFANCKALQGFSGIPWNTSSLTSMSYMFSNCGNLEYLYLDEWDTSNVTGMYKSFYGCNKLKTVRLGDKFSWVRREKDYVLPAPSEDYIADADGKWYDLKAMTAYAPTEIPNNTRAEYTGSRKAQAFAVFSADDNSLNFYKRKLVPKQGAVFEGKTVTNIYEGIEGSSYLITTIPWGGYRSDITSVEFVDEVTPKKISYWFYEFSSCESFNLSKLNTSKTTHMECVFSNCDAIENIDVSRFNTSKVESFRQMFQYCDNLKMIYGIDRWNVSSAKNMSQMFYYCKKLSRLALGYWDTSSLENMIRMFGMCGEIKEIDLSGFNTANVTDMYAAFTGCYRLQKVKLGVDFEWKGTGTSNRLPAPSSNYISGADGKWYNTYGEGYTPAQIPSNKAGTYYASKSLVPQL